MFPKGERKRAKKFKYYDEVNIPTLDSIQNSETLHCFNKNNLTEEYIDLLRDGKVYSSKWKGENVTDIYLEGGRVSASPNFEVIYNICNDFGIIFKNQSIPAIARELWDNFDMKWKQSVFSNDIRRLYMKNDSPMWISAFYQLFDKSIPENYQISAIDQAKQYTSVCLNGGFFTHDILDFPVEYDINEEISYGMYYIETDIDSPPFKKNGFYDYQVIRGALEHDLITHDQIKYYIKGEYSECNDKKLKAFIKHTYDTSPGQAKHVVNTIIGSFGITESRKETKTIITQSPYEANYYRTKLGEHATVKKITDVDGKPVYKIQGYKEIIQMSSDIPIRLQIVNRGNWETYKMMLYVRKSNVIVLGIKTDCIIYAHDPKDPRSVVQTSKNARIGEYREEEKCNFTIEEFKQLVNDFVENKPHRKKRFDFQYTPDEYDWNVERAKDDEYFDHRKLLPYCRVYVKGFAGSGKSYIINNLRKELGDSFLYTSFTHMAANNIDGQTINSALGINFNKNNSAYDKTIRKIIQKYKGIIIDEVNQVPLSLFRILHQLPPEFHIYAFGDHRQETPVEPHLTDPSLYVETTMFMTLMNMNMIELTKQCRADKEFANACIKYHDEMEKEIGCRTGVGLYSYLRKNPFIRKDILTPFVKEWTTSNCPNTLVEYLTSSDINIVKTNELRIFINHQKMLEHKEDNSVEITPSKKNTDGQKMWLYKGLPIISNMTVKGLGILHNELYVVDNFDDTTITLRYQMLNFGVKYLTNRLNKTFIINYDQLRDYFSPGYSFTTYKTEGQTISYPHTIWEFNRMPPKTRYTAITRTTDCKLITIINMNKMKESAFDILAKDVLYKDCKAFIYQITDGMKIYIGSTTDLARRWKEHQESATNGTSKLYKYMQKIGIEHFEMKCLKEFNYVNQSHIYKNENSFIEEFDTIKNGLNEKIAA